MAPDPAGAVVAAVDPVVAVVDLVGARAVVAGVQVVAVADPAEDRGVAAEGRYGWVAAAERLAEGFGESLIRTAAQDPGAVGAQAD